MGAIGKILEYRHPANGYRLYMRQELEKFLRQIDSSRNITKAKWQGGKLMKTIFDVCIPRDEVLRGELREQQFAASLTKVLCGNADAVYGDPATFFANTYATGGLKSLLREGPGRLTDTNQDAAAVVRLEISFSGGKTHNQIALYHVCRGGFNPENVADFVSPELLPKSPIAKIAGVVGPDMDMAEGVDHVAVRIFTLWGELAWQLGYSSGGPEAAREAYEVVRKSDEQRSALGTQVGLLLMAVKPLRKSSRMADISEQVQSMADEEAYYWFSKMTDERVGRRSQKATRILLARE